MKNNELLYSLANVAFYIMAIIVVWNTFAATDWRFLSENARKLWAMAGLGLYAVIMLERYRRKHE